MSRPRLRRLCSSRPLMVGLAASLALACPAVAQAESSTVIIGSGATDVLNEHGTPGNFRLWGLGGFNALAGGTGNNLLVGNGQCPSDHEDTTGVDDATHHWDDYCSTDKIRGAPGAILVGGGGRNTIIGSGGRNLIVSGPSAPAVGFGNTIYGGPAGDVIIAIRGLSAIYPGSGRNLVDARGPASDTINCIAGDRGTVVYADRRDRVRNCARVIYHDPFWPVGAMEHPSLTHATLAKARALLRRHPPRT